MTHNKKVIVFPTGGTPSWRFSDVVYPDGGNPMQDWYDSLSDGGRFLFDAMLKDMQKTERSQDWGAFRGFLHGGKYRSERIWELGFQADGRQHRVLGRFGDERKQAVLFLGCFHKQRVYKPPDALETAYKMARALTQKGMKLHERPIQTDR